MDHTATHWDSGGHDGFEDLRLSGLAHGVEAAFRYSEVDGFGEVEGNTV